MLRYLFLFVAPLAVAAADIQLTPGNLAAALEQARCSPKPVRIIVADGVYPVTEALVLGKDDSQVTWEAAEGARPVFEGGRAIKGWQKAEGGLWKAALPDKTRPIEQLWINGRRATLARSPNKGFFHIAEACGAEVFKGNGNAEFEAFSLYPGHFNMLKNIPAAEREHLLVTVTHAWAVSQCRVRQLNEATRSVWIKGRARYPFVVFEPDQRYWLENFRAALDAPGEWYLDRAAGEILCLPFPGEDMTKAEVIAPVTDRFLRIEGAHDIRFRGISFRHAGYLYPADGQHDGQAATTVDAVIEVAESTGIRFENCEVSRIGRHAIWFKNGCGDSAVTHSHLHDLGGGGVYVGETARPADPRVNRGIVVDDCIIQHGGRLHPAACGVVFTHTQRCAVTHCDIGDFYYTGVSAGWNWGYGDTSSRETLVENNHIHHLGWAYLSDMGGFYGLGTSPGTIVRGNHVHHITAHRYGGWGLYNDEGATDTLMENNLVHDTWNAGFHQHYGYFNTVRNNIFAFGSSAQIQGSRNEPRLRFRYLNNIVVWDPASPLLDGGEWNWKFFDRPERGDPKDSLVFRNNLYWPTDGKIPATLTKTHFSWDEWRKMGRDAGSQFANPLFEDIARRDFRLKPGSPAEKMGFKPWDLTLAGVRRTDAKWLALAAQGHNYPAWDTDAKPWPAPLFRVEQDFEHTSPGLIGIRGAKHDRENKGESIGVTDQLSSPFTPGSKRCLKVQDAPDLRHSYDPVLDIYPTTWDGGTFHIEFDIMAQENADWFFEIRGKSGDFGNGPYLRWQKGKLAAGTDGKAQLADIPPGEWFRVAITAATGAAAAPGMSAKTGTWSLALTRQDGSRETFENLPANPGWISASYMLFSALSSKKTAFFIDNVKMEQR